MKRLSPDAKALMIDIGVCHFMAVLKTPDGKLMQCDFGPVGGDVHVNMDPFEDEAKRGKKCVGGEIRITQLDELPSPHMYIGSTDITMQDIEAFNRGRSIMYELNVNDCRHYVNALVHQATGFQNASAGLVRHQFFHRRAHSVQPADRLLQFTQHLTNAENWRVVQSTIQAAAFAALITASHPAVAAVTNVVPRIYAAGSVPLASMAALLSPMLHRAAALATPLAQRVSATKAVVSSSAVAAVGYGSSKWEPANCVAQVGSAVEERVRRGVVGCGAMLQGGANAVRSSQQAVLGRIHGVRAGLADLLRAGPLRKGAASGVQSGARGLVQAASCSACAADLPWSGPASARGDSSTAAAAVKSVNDVPAVVSAGRGCVQVGPRSLPGMRRPRILSAGRQATSCGVRQPCRMIAADGP